jgi:chromosome segregation ATPase
LTKLIEKDKTAVARATKDFEGHEKELKKIETEYNAALQQMQQLNNLLESESKQAQEMKLAASQLEEYNQLKEQAGIQTTELKQKLRRVENKLNSEKNQLEAIQTNIKNLQQQKSNKAAGREEVAKKSDEVSDIRISHLIYS